MYAFIFTMIPSLSEQCNLSSTDMTFHQTLIVYHITVTPNLLSSYTLYEAPILAHLIGPLLVSELQPTNTEANSILLGSAYTCTA